MSNQKKNPKGASPGWGVSSRKLMEDFEKPLSPGLMAAARVAAKKLANAIDDDFLKYIKDGQKETEKNPKRPPCPECGGTRIVSWSPQRWKCNDCGRQWMKKYRGPFKSERLTSLAEVIRLSNNPIIKL